VYHPVRGSTIEFLYAWMLSNLNSYAARERIPGYAYGRFGLDLVREIALHPRPVGRE